MFLLYGANGYTGRLIVEEALKRGMKPILAGRNEGEIKALATDSGLDYRVFDLSDTAALEAALSDVPLVLHAAGPFVHTAKPMMEACLRKGVHYLDITGEVRIFERAAHWNDKALAAGIMFMPGVGFDVVPTDCLAVYLHRQLPDATSLQLAFAGLGGTSRGTAATMAENLGEPGAVRRDGKLERVPVAYKGLWAPHPDKTFFAMTIPWGDLSTAYRSTGIPNIETYMGISPKGYKFARRSRYIGWLLRTRFFRNRAKRAIQRRPAGPTPEKRLQSRSLIWGKVQNAQGDTRQAYLTTPQGYTLTALTSLVIVEKVLNGHFAPGFQTPAGLYGADLIMEIPGVERGDL